MKILVIFPKIPAKPVMEKFDENGEPIELTAEEQALKGTYLAALGNLDVLETAARAWGGVLGTWERIFGSGPTLVKDGKEYTLNIFMPEQVTEIPAVPPELDCIVYEATDDAAAAGWLEGSGYKELMSEE